MQSSWSPWSAEQQVPRRPRCLLQSPQKTFRERYLHALPHYTGPYSVGYLEIEAPARRARTFSNLKRDHEHILRLDTVLFSIYYPCDLEGESPEKPSRVNWLPRPRVLTCKGYAKFMSLPFMPVTGYIACTSMFTKLPAFRNAKLAKHRPRDDKKRSRPVPREGGEGPERTPTFPVVIFSHGLGGSKTSYSSICGEFASYGFIVVAVEHRDCSGARTYVNLPQDREVPASESEDKLNVDDVSPSNLARKGRKCSRRDQSYLVDYLFPKDNSQDTAPNNARGVDVELRTAQIEMRIAEIEEVYYNLNLLNRGQGAHVASLNLRRKGNVGSSSRGLDGINWDDWTGRMHLESVTMMGHSFGGATTVQVTRTESLSWVGQAILLDAWGPATPAAGQSPEARVSRPILSIGSEAFMHWQENFDRVLDICEEARAEDALAWMLTIRGSTHLSMTDFAVLYERCMSLFMKTLVDPRRSLHLTMASSLEFLKLTLPPEQSWNQKAWVVEGILVSEMAPDSPTAKVSLDHRPEEKWLGVRLRLENEFSLRMRRWRKRISGKLGRKEMPKDKGLVNWGEGNEVWMHLSPSQKEIERCKEDMEWVHDQRRSYVLQCTII